MVSGDATLLLLVYSDPGGIKIDSTGTNRRQWQAIPTASFTNFNENTAEGNNLLSPSSNENTCIIWKMQLWFLAFDLCNYARAQSQGFRHAFTKQLRPLAWKREITYRILCRVPTEPEYHQWRDLKGRFLVCFVKSTASLFTECHLVCCTSRIYFYTIGIAIYTRDHNRTSRSLKSRKAWAIFIIGCLSIWLLTDFSVAICIRKKFHSVPKINIYVPHISFYHQSPIFNWS